MYQSANVYYKKKFGCKVYKLSIDGGFTCPNRDGTLGTGGCIFCSAAGGGEFIPPKSSITQQLEDAKKFVEHKCRSGKYIGYFQSFTNTYGPVEELREKYLEAMAPDFIVGLAIGTRPDCLSPSIISLLKELNELKPISVELGLQTIHDETAIKIHRGYPSSAYLDTVKRLKHAGLEVVTHVILGLPGETILMAVETTRAAVLAGTDGLKFHLLHVLKHTQLCRMYENGEFSCLSLEQYGQWLKACLSQVPYDVVVHRITGDGAKCNLVAPLWSGDKKRVLNYLNNVLQNN